MRKLIIELVVLLGIGGLLWAAFALFIDLPARPSLVGTEKEEEIGRRVREAILRTNGLTPVVDEEAALILGQIADSVEAAGETGQSLKIELVTSEIINAFALPGGYIIVTTGLINFCETPEEFAAVVCHEAGHVANRDVLNRLISNLGLEILLSNDPFVTGEIAKSLASSGYSRSQEREADAFSCRVMEQLGMEPRALASFLRRMNEKSPAAGLYQFEFISSHPDTESRIRDILIYRPAEDFEKRDQWFDWKLLKEKAADKEAPEVVGEEINEKG